MKVFLLTTIFFLITFFSRPPAVLAATTISFDPENIIPKQGEIFNLNLKINTNEPIVGADINFSYEPGTLEFLQISQGEFWNNPQILLNTIDSRVRSAVFSIFNYPGKTGNGNLIRLKIRFIGQNPGISRITVEPTSILASVQGKKIPFSCNPAVVTLLAVSEKMTISPTFTVDPPPPQTTSPTTTFSAEPKITVESVPALPPSQKSPSGILKLIALLFLLFGTLVLIASKKII